MLLKQVVVTRGALACDTFHPGVSEHFTNLDELIFLFPSLSPKAGSYCPVLQV